jgi:hypothetical protein
MGRKRRKALEKQQKRRYGPRSFRDKAVAPKGAHIDEIVQLRKHKKASLPALSAHRYGFGLMWNVVPDLMLWAGVKPWGEYDPTNCHGGRIFGWKKEMPLTEKSVQTILLRIIQKNVLTEAMLESVRKCLSFAWQLKMGVRVYYPQKSRNWDCVKVLYATIDYAGLPEGEEKDSTLPTILAKYEQIEMAFTSEWTTEHEMNFLWFLVGVVCAYDTFVFGLRSNEDVKRIKKSKDMQWFPEDHFMDIGFVDGRAKLPEKHRPWRLGRVCFCEDGKHVSPTADDVLLCCPKTPNGRLNALGNPHPIPFASSSTCPLFASEFIDLFPKAHGRTYPKPNKNGTGFTKYNIWDPVEIANKWFVAQGVTESGFSHNAGRKALGQLLEHNKIPYERGFECHADEFATFKKHYSKNCFKASAEAMGRRTQSDDPDVRLAAMRQIANGMGRGPYKPPPPLSRLEEYMHSVLAKTDPEEADRIRSGSTRKSRVPERPTDLLLSGVVPLAPPVSYPELNVVYQ